MVKGYRPRAELVAVSHSVPGRQITRLSMRDDKTLFLFVFRDEYLTTEIPSNGKNIKAALKDVYADVGWECPKFSRQWRIPVTSTSTVSARFEWIAGQKAARR